jgi:hypothetical protein
MQSRVSGAEFVAGMQAGIKPATPEEFAEIQEDMKEGW